MSEASYPANLASIRRAGGRILRQVHRTPVLTSSTLDERAGRSLFFKCENLQRVGSFKVRGAINAVSQLPAEASRRGVVSHSSGNHAQALALAARLAGIDAHIVMPSSAPAVKRVAVEGYGARVVECEPSFESRIETAARVVSETGGTLIPPYDHPHVIEGQGTVALELYEQVPDLDAIVAPIGGGGLVAGLALAARELSPDLRVFAAEPAGADDAARSKASGQRQGNLSTNTVADGLLTNIGELTWPVVRDLVEDVVVVDDVAIVSAMRLVWERMKLVIEPSAAVPLAAVLSDDFRARALPRVGIVLTGGNVDLGRLPF